MSDYYNHDPSLPPDEETQLLIWYKRIGIILAVSFIFPIYVSAFGKGKLIFPNFQMIGKTSFLTTIMALYPLLAAVAIFLVINKITEKQRPIILLIAGFFPIIATVMFRGNMMAGAMGKLFQVTIIWLLLIMSLIDIYVGSKVVLVHSHPVGRWLSGISGIIFMGLMLLPVDGSGIPIYFSIFEGFKSSTRVKIPGSITLLTFVAIVIFTAFLYAALISIINMRDVSDPTKAASQAKSIVFIGSLALPASFLVLALFSSDAFGIKSGIITVIIKYSMQIAGVIGLIALSMWDLIDQSIPKTKRGADLFSAENKTV